MSADALLDAATRIQAAADDLAAAYRDLTRTLGEYRRAAWQQAGEAGASDVNAIAAPERVAAEVVGVLVAAGLEEVLEQHAGTPTPVRDFTQRWGDRLAREQLASKRRPPSPGAPFALLPGQKLATPDPRSLAAQEATLARRRRQP